MSTVENSPILNEVNYYRILSISNTSTLVEIRNAYEKKLEEVHLEAIAAYSLFPEEETEKQLLKYGQAYVTLANPIARAKYDDELKLTGIGTQQSDFEEESTGISESPLVKNLEQKKIAKKSFDLINLTKYKFSKRSKENGELYGSIKPIEICKTIEELKKVEILPSQIDLVEKIKKIGTYTAKVNLHAEVQAKIHIEVVEEDKIKS